MSAVEFLQFMLLCFAAVIAGVFGFFLGWLLLWITVQLVKGVAYGVGAVVVLLACFAYISITSFGAWLYSKMTGKGGAA